MERQSLPFTIFIHAMALLLGAIILAPVLWLFIMSISSTGDLIASHCTGGPMSWISADMGNF